MLHLSPDMSIQIGLPKRTLTFKTENSQQLEIVETFDAIESRTVVFFVEHGMRAYCLNLCQSVM